MEEMFLPIVIPMEMILLLLHRRIIQLSGYIRPDYTVTLLNAVGNACDQVIVYGKVNNGSINENNDIEVYAHRDAYGNVIAKMIKNKASGTIVRPERSMPAMAVWIITLFAVLVVVCTVLAIGVDPTTPWRYAEQP